MAKLVRLKSEAKESATWRGHRLDRFSHTTRNGGIHAVAFCRNEGCTAEVSILTRPAPNEIEVVGRAVALQCPCR